MKKLGIKRIAALALALMIFLGGVQSGFAVSTNPQTVTVKQNVVKSENGKFYENPEREKYTYFIEPMKDNCPLPESIKEPFILSGTDLKEFKIQFTEPGLYEYRITRQETVPKKDKVTSDKVRYFGFKVKRTENGLEVIPYTCTDPNLDFEEHLNGIVLNNSIYGVEKQHDNKQHYNKQEENEGKTTSFGDLVKTNDPLNIAIWVGVLLAAMIAFIFIKKRDDDNA